MNEEALLRRTAGGDSAALEQLIDRYSAYVYAIARGFLLPPLQPEDCEEVTADVFLSLWRHAGEVERGKLRPWLAAVTRNRARDRLRSLRLSEPLEEDELLISLDPGPEERYELRELRELAGRAVEALPEPDRAIFRRRYYLCQKTDEIADALKLSPAAVRTRLSRGREKLKQILTEGGYRVEDYSD